MKRLILTILLALPLILSASRSLPAQTSAFTYQGSLKSGASAANGVFDFQFGIYASADGGTPLATTTVSAVPVVNGFFTVALNATAGLFDGAPKYLEVRVKPSGGATFETLTPRQPVTSAPYALRSLSAENATNASQLGGVPANQFVLTGDARLSDARQPLPNSPNYIQNSNSPQASANFNISGSGTAGGTLTGSVVAAATQFNLRGERFLAAEAASGNTFAGIFAGRSNPSGNRNSFFGLSAGETNSTGLLNSFFGSYAGQSNTIGKRNSFFGESAGRFNSLGENNSFFGSSAGVSTTTGSNNSFFGQFAGDANESGGNNSFFGAQTGFAHRNGNLNSLFGYGATTADNLTNATAIGANAVVQQSNSLVLGAIEGINGANNSTSVGIGTTTPSARLHVNGTSLFTDTMNFFSGSGNANFFMKGAGAANGINFGVTGNAGTNSTLFIAQYDGSVYQDRFIINADGSVRVTSKLYLGNITSSPDQLAVGGAISFATLGAGGVTQLCRNASNQISTCSSSIRYKINLRNYASGLDLVRRLRPVSFDWKANKEADFGLVAEEVAAVEPLLATRNEKGEVEGVKYDRLGVVLVNAVSEQQSEIEAQRAQLDAQAKTIRRQQAEIDELKAAVCALAPAAKICAPQK